MRTTTLLLALAVVVAIVTFSLRATLQAGQAKAELAAFQPEREARRLEAVQLEERLKVLTEASPGLEQKSTVVGTETGRVSAVANAENEAAPRPAASTRRTAPLTLIANDPVKATAYLKNFRANLDWAYGSIFKAADLSAEQIENFKNVEVGLEEARMDLQAAIDAQGLDPDSAECRKLWADYNKSRGTKKKEVLGDAMNRYLEHYWTQNVRYYAQQLAWSGVFSGDPVTPAQVLRAGDVLVAACKRTGSGAQPGAPDRESLDWAVASAQLKDILSSGQIEILAIWVERDKARTRMSRQIDLLTARFKGQPPTR